MLLGLFPEFSGQKFPEGLFPSLACHFVHIFIPPCPHICIFFPHYLDIYISLPTCSYPSTPSAWLCWTVHATEKVHGMKAHNKQMWRRRGEFIEGSSSGPHLKTKALAVSPTSGYADAGCRWLLLTFFSPTCTLCVLRGIKPHLPPTHMLLK